MNALEALHQCKRAWEATQPQLFWTDENMWGEGWTSRMREPSCSSSPPHPPVSPPRGGLVSAFNGDGANPIQEARRPQKGA